VTVAITSIGHICGLHALATLLGVEVHQVISAYGAQYNKGSRWMGVTEWRHLVKVASDRFDTRLVREAPGGSLRRWVAEAIPGRRYLLRLGNHFVALVDGKVIDQHGRDEAEKLGKKRVTHAAFIS
jgi:hypothetical protein